MDYYGNNQINYSEFLSATINLNHFLTDQKLQTIFNQFDTDDSGVITRENIFYAMQKLGHEMNRKEIDAIIQKHDKDGNGYLSFEEFSLVFGKTVKLNDDIASSPLID